MAPSRVETPQRLDIPEGAIANTVNAVSPGLRVNLRSLWEASNNRWNQWVLNYTQDRQLSLLRALGFDAPTVRILDGLRKQRNLSDYDGELVSGAALKECLSQAKAALHQIEKVLSSRSDLS